MQKIRSRLLAVMCRCSPNTHSCGRQVAFSCLHSGFNVPMTTDQWRQRCCHSISSHMHQAGSSYRDRGMASRRSVRNGGSWLAAGLTAALMPAFWTWGWGKHAPPNHSKAWTSEEAPVKTDLSPIGRRVGEGGMEKVPEGCPASENGYIERDVKTDQMWWCHLWRCFYFFIHALRLML